MPYLNTSWRHFCSTRNILC